MSDDLPPGHPLAPPPPSIDVLQDLASDARVLLSLLEEPHPELSTWQAAVAAQLKRIHDVYRVAAGLDRPDRSAASDSAAPG